MLHYVSLHTVFIHFLGKLRRRAHPVRNPATFNEEQQTSQPVHSRARASDLSESWYFPRFLDAFDVQYLHIRTIDYN